MIASAKIASAKSRIQVAYLIGSLATGGAEGQVIELLRRLDRDRFLPSLILFDPSTSHRAEGLVERVLDLGMKEGPVTSRRLRGVRALMAFLRLCGHLQKRPDILHAHLPAACVLGLTAGRLCRIPVLVGSRRCLSGLYRPADWVYDVADRVTTRFGHAMVGNSAAVTHEIVALDGVPADRTSTIYNGVDTERFHPSRKRLWRSKYGWSEQDVVFGMVANFHSYKRYIDFVETAAILQEGYRNTRFVLVGEDRGGVAPIQAAIDARGLRECVQIVPGTPTPEDLYAAIDVFVNCSESEGFSNVILEAMASGKPVIATAVGGNPEAVVDGVTGFLVPPRSPRTIADVAVRLLEQPMLRNRMGRNARERVEAHFSLARMVQAHEDLYLRLLEQRRGWGDATVQIENVANSIESPLDEYSAAQHEKDLT